MIKMDLPTWKPKLLVPETLPLQKPMTFAIKDSIDMDGFDGYKKGGKIKKTKQSQKQSQSTKINIHIGNKTKSRRKSGNNRHAPPRFPPSFIVPQMIGSFNPGQAQQMTDILAKLGRLETQLNRPVALDPAAVRPMTLTNVTTPAPSPLPSSTPGSTFKLDHSKLKQTDKETDSEYDSSYGESDGNNWDDYGFDTPYSSSSSSSSSSSEIAEKASKEAAKAAASMAENEDNDVKYDEEVEERPEKPKKTGVSFRGKDIYVNSNGTLLIDKGAGRRDYLSTENPSREMTRDIYKQLRDAGVEFERMGSTKNKGKKIKVKK